MAAFASEFGPFAIAVDAGSPLWYHYEGGIVKSCCKRALEHAPTVVGWGVDAGEPYWIVRNSWGPTWGEEGYIRLELGTDQCGITQYPSMPCVCKGCSTQTCAKPAPWPPNPTPIPPPPPPPSPPATAQKCNAVGKSVAYTCSMSDPLCCSAQDNTSGTTHCCPGASPVCCHLGDSDWCCAGDETCSTTTKHQCQSCKSEVSESLCVCVCVCVRVCVCVCRFRARRAREA
jgi:hypothetical protein